MLNDLTKIQISFEEKIKKMYHSELMQVFLIDMLPEVKKQDVINFMLPNSENSFYKITLYKFVRIINI